MERDAHLAGQCGSLRDDSGTRIALCRAVRAGADVGASTGPVDPRPDVSTPLEAREPNLAVRIDRPVGELVRHAGVGRSPDAAGPAPGPAAGG